MQSNLVTINQVLHSSCQLMPHVIARRMANWPKQYFIPSGIIVFKQQDVVRFSGTGSPYLTAMTWPLVPASNWEWLLSPSCSLPEFTSVRNYLMGAKEIYLSKYLAFYINVVFPARQDKRSKWRPGKICRMVLFILVLSPRNMKKSSSTIIQVIYSKNFDDCITLVWWKGWSKLCWSIRFVGMNATAFAPITIVGNMSGIICPALR